MVEVTITALDKIPTKRKFAIRKMPLGARMSRVRAVGKRLLGIERHCYVEIGRLDQGSGDTEWETDLWRTAGYWVNKEHSTEKSYNLWHNFNPLGDFRLPESGVKLIM